MPIRLAVFDLDGTLVDSRRDLATAANALVRELGGGELTEEAVGAMVGDGAAVLVRRALEAAGLDPEHPGAVSRFLALYDAHLLDSTRTYHGIEDLLERVGGRASLAVLTNKPQKPTERILNELRLSRFFSAVIGGDGPYGRKPDPAGLLHLVQSAGVPADATLMVGDSPVDVETARRAGTRLCVVSYGFGYRPAALRPGEALAASAAGVANLF